jgi:SEC-C motif-containing protein
MRSRYTAYVLGDDAYLRYSWHPGTCPADAAGEPGLRWLGLKILAVDAGGEEDASGRVEFVARYKRAGRAYRLHELSEFSRHDGRWVYLRGRPPGPRDEAATADGGPSCPASGADRRQG